MSTDTRYQEAALPEEARTRSRHRVGNVLVSAQFAGLGLALAPLGPRLALGWVEVIGWVGLASGVVVGALALAKLGRATKVHPRPAPGAQLRTTGVYSVVRHPMYLAVLLVAGGVALAGGRLLAILVTPLLALVLLAKIRFEETMLDEQFGWQYAVYASHVPALIPRPRRRRA